jgi:hypothetical protein
VLRALVVFAIILGALPPLARANRVGAFGGLNGSVASGGVSCVVCHGAMAGTGMVQILNVPAQYQLNTSYDLIVRVSDPVQVGAGFEISAEDAVGNHIGALILTDPVNTRVAPGLAGFVTHTATGVNNSVINWIALGHAAQYAVRWQAPPADMGPVTFYAAGNAINNNFLVTGDLIYLTNVTTMSPAVVPDDFDGDGDVDLADWTAMVGCLQGPGVMPTNGQCLVLDADQDDDIDLRDVAAFQRNFTGPG